MDQQMSARERYERGLVLKGVQMFNQAIDDFRKAAVDPQFAGKAHLQIALCLRSGGRLEEAVMEFRQALATRTFSSEEEKHIVYHMGQTLESLGRHEESLEIYNWLKKEDPGFGDVDQRVKHLGSGERRPIRRSEGLWQGWMEEVRTRGRQLKPHMAAVLEQTGQWLSEQAEILKNRRLLERRSDGSPKTTAPRAHQILSTKRPGQPGVRTHGIEKRRHSRVPVRLRSYFSSKGRKVAGDGELRDLSPWGCRVTSCVSVPVGTDLECCIFPHDAANPFIVEGATVRWASREEFGLSFTNVRPGVQRQIAQLCRTRTM